MEGKVIITINEDGGVHTHVEQVDGPTCESLLNPIEGFGVVIEQGHTDDYDKRQRVSTQERAKVRAR